ncbi:MAG: alpha/beta hydrolase [Candidatus Promineifilaceae bacterium]
MEGPHQNQPVLSAGRPLDEAQAAMILVHGRGATADDILLLAGELGAADFACLAPQAAGNTWYPQSFLAPIANNEPGITSGLAVLERLVAEAGAAGIRPERVILAGFSQGACLTLEFVARHARRYGGVLGFSGGLIGPEGTPRHYAGSLDGTPVFLGCSATDPHIPAERVRLTADVLADLGAEVSLRLYPSLGHTINQDEIAYGRGLVAAVAGSGAGRRDE